MGHATRCIPIINELLLNSCEVLIAAEGATAELLRSEFPRLEFLPIMGYRMRYSRKKIFLPFKLFVQFPKIIYTIYSEHQWLKKAIKKYKITAVISDNRFGMYSKKVPCIYITHQLLIKTGNSFTEKIAQQIHYHFIKKYNECWVPDYENDGIAGQLSHPKKTLPHIKYIGCLSRFTPNDLLKKKYDLLIILSGPEPQRTTFEKMLLRELEEYQGCVLFVRGLPDANDIITAANKNIDIQNHLIAKDLNNVILQSGIIVSRCGYTTIMDLIKLGKKAILVPTPGQTEQEYLATYLKEKKVFFTVDQNKFSLHFVLKNAENFPFNILKYDMDIYKNVINQFVQSL